MKPFLPTLTLIVAAATALSLPVSAPGGSPLHEAALTADLPLLRKLLDQPSSLASLDQGYTVLHAAAAAGHADVVDLLVARGADPNVIGRDGLTPLHLAAHQGYTASVRALLERGARLEARSATGATPLGLAAAECQRNAVSLLLTRNAKVDASDTSGQTPLHRAAAKGCVPAITTLVKAGASVSAADAKGNTPLHYAAAGGHAAGLEALLTQGDSVDASNAEGWTALMAAATNAKAAGAVALMRAGAQLEKQDSRGLTALIIAATHRRDEVVTALVRESALELIVGPLSVSYDDLARRFNAEGIGPALLFVGKTGDYTSIPSWLGPANSSGNMRLSELSGILSSGNLLLIGTVSPKDNRIDLTPGAKLIYTPTLDPEQALVEAARRGNLALVKRGLAEGVSSRARRKKLAGLGESALVYAVNARHPEVADLLLSKGADISPIPGEDTVLMIAARRGDVELVKQLISAGAKLATQRRDGAQAIHHAAEAAKSDVVRELLDRGADVAAKMSNGWTPLLVAARRGWLDVVRVLLARGADPNVVALHGTTAIFAAVQARSEDTVALLLSAKADPRSRDSKGKVPLHHAAANGDPGIVESLIASGADVDLPTPDDGETALHLAVKSGDLATVRSLLVRGASVNVSSKAGTTPLSLAASQKNELIATLLRRYATVK